MGLRLPLRPPPVTCARPVIFIARNPLSYESGYRRPPQADRQVRVSRLGDPVVIVRGRSRPRPATGALHWRAGRRGREVRIPVRRGRTPLLRTGLRSGGATGRVGLASIWGNGEYVVKLRRMRSAGSVQGPGRRPPWRRCDPDSPSPVPAQRLPLVAANFLHWVSWPAGLGCHPSWVWARQDA